MSEATNPLDREAAGTNAGGKELVRLSKVLKPSEVALGCAFAWGYPPPLFLAVYIGAKTGNITHAVAQL